MFRPSLILLGLIIGAAIGLFYGWVISPVQYTETDPSSLSIENREQYLILVAAAYKADHNIDRARMRLAKLKDADVISGLASLAQRTAASGGDASALAVLASDLSGGLVGIASPTPGLVFTPEPTPPVIEHTPTTAPVTDATPTNIPSFPAFTPTVPPDYDYTLITREAYCDDNNHTPLIITDVIDSAGSPLPGVRVTVLWANGQDGFVTGLKPEISPSYGDFLMEVGTTYSVQLGTRTPPITGLSAPSCVSQIDNSPYAGAIRLVFQRE
jgi:hypothetical protein